MPRKRRNESQRCQFAKEAYNTTRIYSSITIFLLNYLFFLILKLASVPSWFSDHLHFTLYVGNFFIFGLEERIYFGCGYLHPTMKLIHPMSILIYRMTFLLLYKITNKESLKLRVFFPF